MTDQHWPLPNVQIVHALREAGEDLENAQVAKRELALECDYSYEARCQAKFRELVMADTDFALHVRVPDVVSELCTPRLLTTELVPGVHIDKASTGF